jgi:hypothetical protein
MDRAASLVLGHLAERHPHHPVKPTAGDPSQVGQRALDVLGGAPPQLRRERVPQHLRLVVEAVAADRLAQATLPVAVALPTAHLAAMRTALVQVSGPAGQQLAASVVALGVDRAEARRGERHEQPGMGGDGVGGAFAALETGGDELPGVAAVGLRAGRADTGPAVAAGLEQHPARLSLGRVLLAQLAGGEVGLVDAAGQAHRVGAVAGPADLGQPAGQPGGFLRWFGELVELGQHPRVSGPSGPDSNSSSGRHARASFQG